MGVIVVLCFHEITRDLEKVYTNLTMVSVFLSFIVLQNCNEKAVFDLPRLWFQQTQNCGQSHSLGHESTALRDCSSFIFRVTMATSDTCTKDYGRG